MGFFDWLLKKKEPEPAQEPVLRKPAKRNLPHRDAGVTAKIFAAGLNDIPRQKIDVAASGKRHNKAEAMPAINLSYISRRSSLKTLFPLVVVDVETTGLSPTGHEIIEVSAIKYTEPFRPDSCFTSLTRPSRAISAQITDLTGISNDLVKGCPKFSQIAESFSDFIAGCNVVGHNLRFDLEFLHVGGVRLPDGVRYFDTLALAKKVLLAERSRVWDSDVGHSVQCLEYDVDNYKLGTLCDYYGIQRDVAHRSLADCYATGLLFEALFYEKRRLAEEAEASGK